MKTLFGPAGTPQEFYDKGYKSSLQMPGFLENSGLDCFEYQCGRGVNISEATAQALGAKAREHSIVLSLHTPYYISLSSNDEDKRLKSIEYIMQSAVAAKAMGAQRLVVHSGSCSGMTREDALALACSTLKTAALELDAQGYSDIILCPETMGKTNQLGNIDEVITLCKVDERFIPTIDFGHLNAREQGMIKTAADYEDILNRFFNGLGRDRMQSFHCHFSRIEWSQGGEKRHLTFEDEFYGPFHEPFLEAVYKLNLTPVIICESAGTQAKDAVTMKDYYHSLKI